MASIRPHKGRWRVEVYVNGKRRSKVCATKSLAKDWARGMVRDTPTGDVDDIPLPEMLDEYEVRMSARKGSHDYERKRFAAWKKTSLGKLTTNTAQPKDIARYRDDRLLEVQGSTVNREFNTLSNVFTMAVEWGYRSDTLKNPVSGVKRPADNPPRDRRVTDDEIERICFVAGFTGTEITTVRQRVAIAFLFAIETAMREGEVAGIRPEHIEDRVVHLPKTKNGTKRDVPLSTRAAELLSLVEGNFRLKASQIDANFRPLRERAGIDDLRFHDTRHEAISRLARKMPVLSLARMTGHKDLKKLMIYYNETAKDLVDLLD